MHLNTAQTSLRDVLKERRKHLKTRLGASLILPVTYGVVIGWHWITAISASYALAQLFEILIFSGKRPWLSPGSRYWKTSVLVMLSLNAIIFGAPSVVLTRQLGTWGDVYSVYLLCAAMLNTLSTTIGCRAAFRASATPLFIYMFLLPINSFADIHPPNLLVVALLFANLVYLSCVIIAIWRSWTDGKAAEVRAVRRYIAGRNAAERRLLRLTQQDSLTCLPNRAMLQARLAKHVADGAAAALLMIDLDGFKYVNDTLGHSAGDAVLCQIADRIREAAGPADLAARLGGDEFALLLAEKSDPLAILTIAEALISEVSQPVMVDGHQINIGASIGIALHPLHGQDAVQLFANADLALYQAKAEGRQCGRLYHADLRLRAAGKVRRDTELGQALERGEFEIFYQPQFRLADGALAGAEALLRWRHPTQGLLKPAAFLTALEGGLLSARVGAWAIQSACRQAAAWRAQAAPDFRIGVNLFGAQFRSGNLVAWVSQALADAGLPPTALEIEITENIILRHEDNIIAPLQELRTLGVGVAFDDYGTGFASLSMLTRFPVSRLKIDRSFTESICQGAPAASIIQAIITLARALNLLVTAEGIETREQAEALAAEGCDEAQGHYFGRPMNAEDFTRQFVQAPRFVKV